MIRTARTSHPPLQPSPRIRSQGVAAVERHGGGGAADHHQEFPHGLPAPSLAGKNAPRADDYGDPRKGRPRHLRSRGVSSRRCSAAGDPDGQDLPPSPPSDASSRERDGRGDRGARRFRRPSQGADRRSFDSKCASSRVGDEISGREGRGRPGRPQGSKYRNAVPPQAARVNRPRSHRNQRRERRRTRHTEGAGA